MKDKCSAVLAILFFGLSCGVGFQIYKVESGGDDFWNYRLLFVLILGILFFYLVNYLNVRALKLFLGGYDGRILREDLKTYLPLGLLNFFPLQKRVINRIWPESNFIHLVGIYILVVLVLKVFLIANAKKESFSGREESQAPLVCVNWLFVAALAIGVPLFWFHQLTLSFGEFFGFWRFGKSQSFYLRNGDVTRKTFLYDRPVEVSARIPYERSRAVVGYKIFDGPAGSPENSVPICFELRVTDDEGNLIASRKNALNSTDEASRKWQNFEIDLDGFKADSINFEMRARPQIMEMGWQFLRDFFFHSPVDFSYYNAFLVRAAWSEPEIVSLGEGRTNIILISLDTLRADALGCYGYEKNVSPTIDSFARENVMFENAFSQSTWTLPSHLSMLTSRFVNEFGEFKFGDDYIQVAQTKQVPQSGARSIPAVTLPEIFKERGYYCAGFTDGVFMSFYYGFYQGFHVYNERYGPGGNSFRLAEEWISENLDKNFFVLIHSYFIHDYIFKDKPTHLGGSEQEVEELLHSTRSFLADVEGGETPSSVDNGPRPRDWYDIRIKLADSYLSDFFSFLKERNLYDDAMIILLSDHGESFQEVHNDGKTIVNYHAEVPYDSQIRVPLIMKLPARLHSGPSVVKEDVRLLDVAPSILASLGFDINPEFRGRSVLPGFETAEKPGLSFVHATWAGNGGCIRENQKKYIYLAKGREEEFYDLAKDPYETRNLASRQTEEMGEMKRKYFEFVSVFGLKSISMDQSANAAPADLRDDLKALGYLN